MDEQGNAIFCGRGAGLKGAADSYLEQMGKSFRRCSGSWIDRCNPIVYTRGDGEERNHAGRSPNPTGNPAEWDREETVYQIRGEAV